MRKRVKKVPKRPRLLRATDAQGTQLKVGQRVRHADAIYRVDKVFEVEQDGGRVECVYFRRESDPTIVAQIHLPLVTILDDGPPKRKVKRAAKAGRRSVRSRLRR